MSPTPADFYHAAYIKRVSDDYSQDVKFTTRAVREAIMKAATNGEYSIVYKGEMTQDVKSKMVSLLENYGYRVTPFGPNEFKVDWRSAKPE